MIDDFSRLCLALEVATSITGERVTRILDHLLWQYGKPKALERTDIQSSHVMAAAR